MSETLLYTGSAGARELAPRFDKRDGVWETTRRWRGLKGDLLTIAEATTNPNATLTQEDEFWWLLESPSPGLIKDVNVPPTLESQVVTLWTLAASRFAKSVWELPKVKKQFNLLYAKDGITNEERVGFARFRSDFITLARGEDMAIRADPKAKAGQSASEETIKITLDEMLKAPVVPPTDKTVWLGLFDTLAQGVDSYMLDSFVLRKRMVAPNGAKIYPAYANTNRAIKTSTLLSQESTIPTIIRTGIPTGFWFKSAPTVDQTDPVRFEITQEWTFADDYSYFVYENPI